MNEEIAFKNQVRCSRSKGRRIRKKATMWSYTGTAEFMKRKKRKKRSPNTRIAFNRVWNNWKDILMPVLCRKLQLTENSNE